mmetsp:Transcript_26661/g.44592  ORF Transcript_26661/g.44592 Transcript_26661/m.44592 type:complete len:258 (+) Transcript_26661:33-806(+)
MADETEIRAAFEEAKGAKDEGNLHYKENRWSEAIESYTKAIEIILKLDVVPNPSYQEDEIRKNAEAVEEDGGDKETNGDSGSKSESEGTSKNSQRWVQSDRPEVANVKRVSSGLDDRWKNELAIYYSNRAATYLQLGKYQRVIDDCGLALELSPQYVKALVRRAQAYEAVSKKAQALADLKKAVAVEPNLTREAQDVRRLERDVAEEREKEKEEMLGKLKDLGNMFLGKFGLSTDNFKVNKDSGSGSYNISFSQNSK